MTLTTFSSYGSSYYHGIFQFASFAIRKSPQVELLFEGLLRHQSIRA